MDIRIENLCISYSKQRVIDGLNLAFGNNRTAVFVGRQPASNVTCTPSKTLKAPATTCTAVLPPGSPGETVPITVQVGRTTAVDDAGNYTYKA